MLPSRHSSRLTSGSPASFASFRVPPLDIAREAVYWSELASSDRMNNFYEQFAATAERFAAHPAVEVQRRDRLDCFTYAELRAMAERAAAFLAARGIAPRDRCAILADNDAR